MGNVTLPTPVFIAGGALCLAAGYLVGTVAGPETPDRTTATVASFDERTSELCLSGEAVEDEDGLTEDGELCGIWTHAANATTPKVGDTFRFVAMDTSGVSGAEPESRVLIYGSVDK